jgi:hypothetical protein
VAVLLAVFSLKKPVAESDSVEKPRKLRFPHGTARRRPDRNLQARNTLSAASGAGAAYISASRLGPFRQPVGSPRNFDGHDVACHLSSP